MAQVLSASKFTYEDYLLFPADGKRHELIDGAHCVTPAPRTKHQRISQNLSGLLYAYVTETRAGQIFCAPTDVVLSDVDIVQPDLLFISATRLSIITDNNIQGPPDLVVEILSEASRNTDEIIKRKLYERHHIPEYWIIDPELETVNIYRLSDQGYSQRVELSLENNEPLTSSLFSGWTLSLRTLFE